MMIAATLALLLAQAAAPAQGTVDEDTILVIGERMRSIDVNVGRDAEGTWHCSLSASTGSDWVDDRLCRITTGCVRDAGGDRERSERCISRRRASIMDEFREAIERGRS